jgi:hypothetical protein
MCVFYFLSEKKNREWFPFSARNFNQHLLRLKYSIESDISSSGRKCPFGDSSVSNAQIILDRVCSLQKVWFSFYAYMYLYVCTHVSVVRVYVHISVRMYVRMCLCMSVRSIHTCMCKWGGSLSLYFDLYVYTSY